MDKRDKEKLRQSRLQLSQDLSLEEIWDPLIQEELFTPNELIKLERNKDPITRLLDKLEQKGPNALHCFQKALQHINKPHLAELFNEHVNEKANEKTIKNKDTGIQVKKEFEEKPDHNDSGCQKHPEDCQEVIEKLQRKLENCDAELEEEISVRKRVEHENEELSLKVRQTERNLNNTQIENFYLRNLYGVSTEAFRSRSDQDFKIFTCMNGKINMLTTENNCLRTVLQQFIDTNRQLRNENTNLMNKLDQTMLTRKRKYQSDKESKSPQRKKRKTGNEQSGQDTGMKKEDGRASTSKSIL